LIEQLKISVENEKENLENTEKRSQDIQKRYDALGRVAKVMVNDLICYLPVEGNKEEH
jgi:hypothetical protein